MAQSRLSRHARTSSSPPPFLAADGLIAFAPNDKEDPQNWSTARRWYLTFAATLLVLNATIASSGPSGCLDSIADTFDVSSEVASLVVSIFLLAYCVGPFLWAPLSEWYGRLWIFRSSFVGYTLSNFLCAFAPNLAALLVGRALTGFFASSTLSNTPGLLADVWSPTERGVALAVFSFTTFAGPALGPVIAGFCELKEDWRWLFYALLWLAGVSFPFACTIPETFRSGLLRTKAIRARTAGVAGWKEAKTPLEATGSTLLGILKERFTLPWVILFDPICFTITIYTALIYMLLYMLFAIYPIVFRQMRGWNSGVSELPLLGAAVGAGFGALCIFCVNRNDERNGRLPPRNPHWRPEQRLGLAKVGGILFPITMFWFAWTANYNSIHWAVPTIAGTFLASSLILTFVAYISYLTDCYIYQTASAFAANSVFRAACGAAAPLFTTYMFDALSVAGGGSLIAGVAALLAIVPFIFARYGEQIRRRSQYCVRFEDNILPEPSCGTVNDAETAIV